MAPWVTRGHVNLHFVNWQLARPSVCPNETQGELVNHAVHIVTVAKGLGLILISGP